MPRRSAPAASRHSARRREDAAAAARPGRGGEPARLRRPLLAHLPAPARRRDHRARTRPTATAVVSAGRYGVSLSPDQLEHAAFATGIPIETLERMLLARYAGRAFEQNSDRDRRARRGGPGARGADPLLEVLPALPARARRLAAALAARLERGLPAPPGAARSLLPGLRDRPEGRAAQPLGQRPPRAAVRSDRAAHAASGASCAAPHLAAVEVPTVAATEAVDGAAPDRRAARRRTVPGVRGRAARSRRSTSAACTCSASCWPTTPRCARSRSAPGRVGTTAVRRSRHARGGASRRARARRSPRPPTRSLTRCASSPSDATTTTAPRSGSASSATCQTRCATRCGMRSARRSGRRR